MNRSFSLALSKSTSTTTPVDVLIEQEEFDTTDSFGSRMSKSQIASFIRQMMLKGFSNSVGQCGVDVDGKVVTAIRVFPRLGVEPITTKLSYGLLSSATTHIDNIKEVIKVSLAGEFSVKYPVYDSLTLVKIGDVYDKYGNITTAPSNISISVDSIKLSKKVYGSFEVSYNTKYFRHEVVLPKREASPQNKYSSVAYAVYKNGVSWLKLKSPPAVEDTSDNELGCGRHVDSGIIDTPGDCNPTAKPVHRVVNVDYCSQTVTSINDY